MLSVSRKLDRKIYFLLNIMQSLYQTRKSLDKIGKIGRLEVIL